MPRRDAESTPPPGPRSDAEAGDLTDPARIEAELTTLASLAVATSAARSRREIADTALAILCPATGAGGGLILTVDRAYEAAGWFGLQDDAVRRIARHGAPEPRLIAALRRPDTVIVTDLGGSPLRPEVRDLLASGGLSHLLFAGLWVSGRLLGVLALGWRTKPPTLPTNSVILHAAALIASSLENARLLEQVEQGLVLERSLATRLETLVELTRMQVDAGDPAAIVDDLLKRIIFVLGATAGSVVQVDGSHLRTLASRDMDPAIERIQVERPASEWGSLKRFASGTPAFVASITEDSVSAAAFRAASAAGYRAYAAFPVRDGTRLVAVLFALFHQPAAELPIDQRTLQGISRVVDISFANQRLRNTAIASEERYRTLFERSPDALVVQDLDGTVIDANPTARKLFGDAVTGSHVLQLTTMDEGELAGLRRTVSTDGAATWVGVGRRLDGRTFPAEIEAARIQIEGVERVLNRVHDTTERDRLGQELLQAQKMEAIGLLVAGVAHELNNPLASILAFSQLIRTDQSLPLELHHQADLLIQEARRTHRIVKGLLDFARQRPPERLPTSLREIVDEVLGLQSYTFAPGRLEAIVDIPDDIPAIPIDRAQMQQVLVNLTLNAAQAIRSRSERGTIRIVAATATTDEGEEVVRLSITDDGPGIPAELRSRLFVPFFTTKAPGEGTGLGLSVSFGIVVGHGGMLRHESGPGGIGTTFIVELPVRQANGPPTAVQSVAALAAAATAPDPDPSPDSVPDQAAPAEAGSPSTASGQRILVLDDESSIRDFLARILRRRGYEPVSAVDGASALEIVRADPPEAILCDNRMAGMSGIAFHEAVEAIDPGLARRFAFMSGDVLNPELHDFAVARGLVLLAKPFDMESVARTVDQLVARGDDATTVPDAPISSMPGT